MTEEQIRLVKQSWRVFRSVDPLLIGDLFYSKLFADHPSLRKMFPKDMNQQHIKLIDMITVIVSRLDHWGRLTEDISAMAQRHVGYGARPAHYIMVGKALFWTLEKGLGNEWNPQVAEAWNRCYNILADNMIKAGEDLTTVTKKS